MQSTLDSERRTLQSRLDLLYPLLLLQTEELDEFPSKISSCEMLLLKLDDIKYSYLELKTFQEIAHLATLRDVEGVVALAQSAYFRHLNHFAAHGQIHAHRDAVISDFRAASEVRDEAVNLRASATTPRRDSRDDNVYEKMRDTFEKMFTDLNKLVFGSEKKWGRYHPTIGPALGLSHHEFTNAIFEDSGLFVAMIERWDDEARGRVRKTEAERLEDRLNQLRTRLQNTIRGLGPLSPSHSRSDAVATDHNLLWYTLAALKQVYLRYLQAASNGTTEIKNIFKDKKQNMLHDLTYMITVLQNVHGHKGGDQAWPEDELKQKLFPDGHENILLFHAEPALVAKSMVKEWDIMGLPADRLRYNLEELSTYLRLIGENMVDEKQSSHHLHAKKLFRMKNAVELAYCRLEPIERHLLGPGLLEPALEEMFRAIKDLRKASRNWRKNTEKIPRDADARPAKDLRRKWDKKADDEAKETPEEILLRRFRTKATSLLEEVDGLKIDMRYRHGDEWARRYHALRYDIHGPELWFNLHDFLNAYQQCAHTVKRGERLNAIQITVRSTLEKVIEKLRSLRTLEHDRWPTKTIVKHIFPDASRVQDSIMDANPGTIVTTMVEKWHHYYKIASLFMPDDMRQPPHDSSRRL